MYETANNFNNQKDIAEDMMKESFIKAFQKIENFDGKVLFGAWLKRIVINKSIHHYRKQIRRNETPIDDILYKIEDNADDIDSNYEFNSIKANQILDTMKTLKDNYRIALTLNLIEGYDYEEISTILKISNANCRTTNSRAKESL